MRQVRHRPVHVNPLRRTAMVPVVQHHARIRVRIIRPVRRGPIRAMTVHVMRDMAVMQQRVSVQSAVGDTINPVRVMYHVQTVVRGITVPVVRIVRIVRRVHTVQRPI